MIFFDLETHLITLGCLAPPIVCGALCHGADPDGAYLVDRPTTCDHIARDLRDGLPFCGHNVAYDFGCVLQERPDLAAKIFRAYRENRVTDTMIRQELIDIAAGCHHGFRDGVRVTYSLGALSARLLDRPMAKGEDTWRLRYRELDGVPIEDWPEAARAYPILDVETTRDVYDVQEAEVPPEWLVDQYAQARAAWALHLTAAWGITTDPVAVAKLERTLSAERETIGRELLGAGLVSRKKDGTIKRNVKAVASLVERSYRDQGREVPLTKGEGVSTSADACRESGDPLLIRYGRLGKIGSLLDKSIPKLKQGTLHTRYGLTANGRSSSQALEDGAGGDNLQNMPRKGGVRECLVPRPGHVFVIVDYGIGELCCLAQTCLDWFGESALADAINAGLDVHRALGTEIQGCAYDEVTKETRQFAKIPNFGFPGGLAPKTLIAHALKQTEGKTRITLAQAYELKAAWLRRWPEMNAYFARVNALISNGGQIEQAVSRRLRGRVGFTDACNTFFSGRLADIAKTALFDVVEACFVPSASPLYGCRTVLFAHDEIVTEAPEEIAAEAAEEQSRLMIAAAKPFLPDVKIEAVPMLARRYSKECEPVRDERGRLVPWSP